jgi:hypothetical protein
VYAADALNVDFTSTVCRLQSGFGKFRAEFNRQARDSLKRAFVNIPRRETARETKSRKRMFPVFRQR